MIDAKVPEISILVILSPVLKRKELFVCLCYGHTSPQPLIRKNARFIRLELAEMDLTTNRVCNADTLKPGNE